MLLSINRQPDSNTVQVANEVHAEIANSSTDAAARRRADSFYDQSNIVKASIGSVRDAIIIGLFLRGFIIWLFLRDLGTALLAGVVVPVTICVTFVGMKMLGQSFNMMTLGGLAAAGGLVIDDAIVVVENIVLHRDGGEVRSKPPAARSQRTHGSADRLDADADCRVSAADFDHRRHGYVFPRAGDRDELSLLTSLVLALGWTTNLGTYLIRHESGGIESASGIRRNRTGRTLQPRIARKTKCDRMMAAEEASLRGFFGRVIAFYERWMRRALEHPAWLVGFCAI